MKISSNAQNLATDLFLDNIKLTGNFIPKHIQFDNSLTHMGRMLLATIYHLSRTQKGCIAGLDYLAHCACGSRSHTSRLIQLHIESGHIVVVEDESVKTHRRLFAKDQEGGVLILSTNTIPSSLPRPDEALEEESTSSIHSSNLPRPALKQQPKISTSDKSRKTLSVKEAFYRKMRNKARKAAFWAGKDYREALSAESPRNYSELEAALSDDAYLIYTIMDITGETSSRGTRQLLHLWNQALDRGVEYELLIRTIKNVCRKIWAQANQRELRSIPRAFQNEMKNTVRKLPAQKPAGYPAG